MTEYPILYFQEDTVVNSTGKTVNLAVALSKAIAKKAGPDFEEACAAMVPLDFGSVKATSGFNMPCKQILSCNCHHYNEGKNKEVRL